MGLGDPASLGGDPDLVLPGAGHQAGRQRRGIAEHGVRPPEARADLAREDAPLAHPDVNRERKALVQDRPVIMVLMNSVGKLTRVADASRIRTWMEEASRMALGGGAGSN